MYKDDHSLELRITQLAAVLDVSRMWHSNLQAEFKIHAAVIAASKVGVCCDWHRLVLEWPHRSNDDPKQIAYTRDERKGLAGVQTRSPIGKYLKRHFPDLKDDVIRDITYNANASGCSILRTTKEIVQAVQNGPESCMKWEDDGSWSVHPYEVYTPEFGWAIAVRTNDDGVIDGRALVYEADGNKCYVRSFLRTDGWSPSDHELEAWMFGQGYEHQGGCSEGAKLARVYNNRNATVYPYIDGDQQKAEVYMEYIEITESGSETCDCTDGSSEESEEEEDYRACCPDCGDRTDDDDQAYLDEGGDSWVCSGCRRRDYTYIGNNTYIRDQDVVTVNGQAYDENNLPDFIVTLADGEYCHMDNAVYCDASREYYSENDMDVIRLENGDPCHLDYAFQCSATHDWYLKSEVEPVEVNDRLYHPDNVPEPEEEEEEDETQSELEAA